MKESQTLVHNDKVETKFDRDNNSGNFLAVTTPTGYTTHTLELPDSGVTTRATSGLVGTNFH